MVEPFSSGFSLRSASLISFLWLMKSLYLVLRFRKCISDVIHLLSRIKERQNISHTPRNKLQFLSALKVFTHISSYILSTMHFSTLLTALVATWAVIASPLPQQSASVDGCGNRGGRSCNITPRAESITLVRFHMAYKVANSYWLIF